MSLLEGHGNYVMNELGRGHVAGQERMARVLHQRRKTAASAADAEAARHRDEDAPVRGRRAVRARRAEIGGRHGVLDAAWQRTADAARRVRGARHERLAALAARAVARCARVSIRCRPCSTISRAGTRGRRRLLGRRRLARAARARCVRARPRRSSRCTSITVCGRDRRRLRGRRGRGDAFGARGARRRVDDRAGPQPRGPGPRRARTPRSNTRGAEVGCGGVLVGHTADDQAETVLLQLLRGAARPGSPAMARGRARRAAAARPAAARHARDLRAPRLAPVVDPMNDELASPARLAAPRGDPAPRSAAPTATCRGARAPGRGAARRRRSARRARRRARPPATPPRCSDAAAIALARRVRPALARCAAAALARDGRRVLAVARGERRAVELPAARSSASRRPARARSRRRRPPIAAPTPVALAVPGRGRVRGIAIEAWIEHAAPVAWPDGRDACVVDADRVGDHASLRPAAPGERFRRSAAAARSSCATRWSRRESRPSRRRRSSRPVVVGGRAGLGRGLPYRRPGARHARAPVASSG